MTLKESSEDDASKASIDYVVHQCAEMIGLDSLIFQLADNLTNVRIVSVHETTEASGGPQSLADWCR